MALVLKYKFDFELSEVKTLVEHLYKDSYISQLDAISGALSAPFKFFASGLYDKCNEIYAAIDEEDYDRLVKLRKEKDTLEANLFEFCYECNIKISDFLGHMPKVTEVYIEENE